MVVILALIGFSFVTATALILTNKKLMTDYGFDYPTLLTGFHFFLSTLFLSCLRQIGLVRSCRNVGPCVCWYTAAFGVGSIVLMNWNLKVNSVGFYQLSKICNIPVMVLYKWFFKKMETPIQSLLSLFVLLTGVGLFTVSDVEFNWLGTFIAALAVLSTSIFQSRSAFMQTEYDITGPQLNLLLAGPEFVLCGCLALCLEVFGSSGVVVHEFCRQELAVIALTGIFAVYGNLVGFVMIGRTGPVTFQVIGHVKTILVFVFGILLFPARFHETRTQRLRKICGLALAMFGVVLYTWFEVRLKIKPRSPREKGDSIGEGDLTSCRFGESEVSSSNSVDRDVSDGQG